MTQLKQVSFAGGIIAPNMWGRSDQEKWQAGLSDAANMQVNRYGNVENRPGTEYGGTCRALSGMPRCIPFVVSSSQSYIFEVSESHIRVWKNNALLYQPLLSFAAWSNATTYDSGDIVRDGVNNTLYWSRKDLNVNNAVSAGPWWYPLPMVTINGVIYAITEIPAPLVAPINLIQYAQINDVMTFVGQTFRPVQLKHYNDQKWGLSYPVVDLPIQAPRSLALSGTGGATAYRYIVQPVIADGTTPGQMACATGSSLNVTSATFWDNGRLDIVLAGAPAVPFAAGDPVYIEWGTLVGGVYPWLWKGRPSGVAKGNQYRIVSGSGTNYTLQDGPATGTSTTLASGGSPIGVLSQQFVYILSLGPNAGNPNNVSWDAASGALKYNVYRNDGGGYCFIGSTSGVTFSDIGYTLNVGSQPALDIPMFTTTSDYPAAVGIYQQRLWFGNTAHQPQSYWASRIGQYGVFSASTPTVDSDAFTFVLAGQQVQFINAFVDIGKLIIHTSNGEYVVNGNASGAVTPTSQNIVKAGQAGSYPGVNPVSIGLSDLFIQARGGMLRDLQFDIRQYNYQGREVSLFASNLFTGRTVVEMAWQQTPNSIVWVVLDDGTMLGLTYNREQNMWAWHRHFSASGLIKSVAVIPESGVDSVYMIVYRNFGDNIGTLYMERMYQRNWTDFVTDGCFTDCSSGYDGRNTTNTTLTITSAGGWTPPQSVTVTASAGVFAASDATNGNLLVIRQALGSGLTATDITLTITGYTSATQVTASINAAIPAWAQNTPIYFWGKAVKHFSGATQLSNTQALVLGDGLTEYVNVDNTGAFITASYYLIAKAGYEVTSYLETLDWENAQGETIMGRRKDINEMTLMFITSRGGLFGLKGGALYEVSSFGPAYAPETATGLITGPRRFTMSGSWNPTSAVRVKASAGLPLTIGALISSGTVGG